MKFLDVWLLDNSWQNIPIFIKLSRSLFNNIDFNSRGNILNNNVNLPYGPQIITIATKHTIDYKKLKRVIQDLEFWPKQVYLQYNSMVVDMKRNQKYQSFIKYNISDWNLETSNYPKVLTIINNTLKPIAYTLYFTDMASCNINCICFHLIQRFFQKYLSLWMITDN